jgi:hypothetical protein
VSCETPVGGVRSWLSDGRDSPADASVGHCAARDRPTGHDLGVAAVRGGQTAAHRTRGGRYLLDDERFLTPWRVLSAHPGPSVRPGERRQRSGDSHDLVWIDHQIQNLVPWAVRGASNGEATTETLDHPFDHPDDPTGPVWIRPDRRRIQPEQARSVWGRPDRRRAPGYGSGGWGFESLAARQKSSSKAV